MPRPYPYIISKLLFANCSHVGNVKSNSPSLFLPFPFPVFGEVPRDPALQIRQSAVHPANEALTLMPCAQWKDQNPDSVPFLWHPRANRRVAKIKPCVVWHTHSHMYMHVVMKACRPSITLMQSMLWMTFCDFGASLYFCHFIYIWLGSFLRRGEIFLFFCFRSVLIKVECFRSSWAIGSFTEWIWNIFMVLLLRSNVLILLRMYQHFNCPSHPDM